MPAQTSDRPFYAVIGLLVIAAILPLAVWGDPRAWLLLRNTIALAAATCALALPAGVVLVFLLLRTDLVGRKVFLLAFGALLFVPLYLQAAGWEAGVGKLGWFSFAHGSVAEPILDGWRASIWIHGLAAVPWVMLIVGLGLRLLEPDVEDAALLEGSWASVFWQIIFPRLFPFLVVAALWIVVATGTEMTVTDLYQVRTFAEEIYIDIPYVGSIDSLDPLRPTAFTQFAFVVCLIVTALVLAGKLAPPDHLPSHAARRALPLRGWRWAALGFVLLAMVVMIAVPIGNLIFKAGLQSAQAGSQQTRRWAAGAFIETVADSPSRFGEEYGWTILIGGAASAIAIVIAAPLAWLARRGKWTTAPALITSAVCLAVPGPLIGMAVIWLLNREGSELLIWLYDRSIFAPWLAMLTKCLPLAILISWYAFRTVPDKIVESASSEGASRLTCFWRIGVLQHRLALGGAWLAAFAIASGDLAASILVMPPGVSTIPVRVFGLLHSGVDDQVAGICLTNIASFLLVGSLCYGVVRVLGRRLGNHTRSE